MVIANSIFKNSTILVLGNLGQRVLSFFTIVLVSRYLGPASYGQYTFVISLITIAAVFWNFGLNTVLTRDIASEKSTAANLMGQAIIIKSVLFSIIFISIYSYARLSGYNNEIVFAIILFGVGTFISTLNEVFKTVFAAFRRMEYSALLNLTRSFSVLVVIIIVSIFSEKDLVLVFVAYFIGFLSVHFLALGILKSKFVLPVFLINKTEILNIFMQAKPFVMIAAADIVLFRVDHLMLSRIAGDAQLGLYGAAYTLFEIVISMFPMMIMGAAFPVLSVKYCKDLQGFKDLSNVIMKLFLYLGLPMSSGLVLLGSDICYSIYGQEYYEAGLLLSILGFSVWMFFLSVFLGWALTAMRLQNFVLRATIFAMVLNIVGNCIAIPVSGAKGAAFVTIFCEFFQLVLLYWFFRKNVHIDNDLKIWKIIFSVSVMSLSVYGFLASGMFTGNHTRMIGAVMIGIIVYALISVPFGIISKHDLATVRKQ